MKQYLLSIVILLAYSCTGNMSTDSIYTNDLQVPSHFMLKSSHDISLKNDMAFFKKGTYDGYLYQLYPNGKDTLSMEGYVNGHLSGCNKKWFSNKQLMEVRYYSKGKKNGKQIAYWPNGYKRFEFVAKDDSYEGELQEWSQHGHLFHLANFVNGQEEGVQKMWYENGKIKANYVIMSGKRYGLLGTKNCKNVSDSIFKVN